MEYNRKVMPICHNNNNRVEKIHISETKEVIVLQVSTMCIKHDGTQTTKTSCNISTKHCDNDRR